MAFGDVGADSFEFYEGIRIFVPGALAVGLIIVLQWTLSGAAKLNVDVGTALVGSVGLGLLLLFVDIPRISALYNTDLPSDIFDQRYAGLLKTLKTGTDRKPVDARNAFFLVADVVLPSTIRSRSLYYGSMFRIGFESILLLGSFQFVPWMISIWKGNGSRAADAPDNFWWLIGVAALPILWPISVLAARAFRKGLRNPTTERPGHAALLAAPRKLVEDLGPWDVAILILSVGLVALGLAAHRSEPQSRYLLLSGLVVAALLWQARFIFGRPKHESNAKGLAVDQRVAFDRLTNLALFLLVSISCAVISRYDGNGAFLSDTNRVAVWLLAMAATSLLIASRGIEKRLRGGYGSQSTWLKLNQGEVLKALGLEDDGTSRP